MRAARFHGREDLRIEDLPDPEAGPGEVLLRPAYTGICGTDLHVYFTPESSGFDFSRPHELTGATLPQVFGHEFSGTVVSLGAGVSGLAEGDRVAVWPLHSCGDCAACVAGLESGCRRLACQGISSPGGGMSELTTVRADKTYPLPDGVDLLSGALVEPMATAWHAVRRGGVTAERSVLVVGGGPIGVGLWLALRALGVERVVVSEPSVARRAVLSGLGAPTVVDPADAPAAVAELTGGHGVDVAFEAAGVGDAVTAALAALAPRGTLVIVALHEREFGFNPTAMVFAENTVVGSIAYTADDFREVIAAMALGSYPTGGWVSTVGLADAGQALRDLRAGRGMKILVRS